MKKLDKTTFNESIVLSNEQMKSIFGSCADAQYFLRCNQYSTKGQIVENCERETVIRICGSVTNAVCIGTGVKDSLQIGKESPSSQAGY